MSASEKIDTAKWNFVAVKDPSVLFPLLKERHPISCMVYNQVMRYEHFKNELEFYTIGEQLNSDTWIVSNNKREDYGCSYTISAPTAIAEGKTLIPEYVKDCFTNGGLVQWKMTDDIMTFTASPIPIAKMIIQINAEVMGNITDIHPGDLYFMEMDDALNLEVGSNAPNIELRRLDASKNEADFLLKEWKYTLPGSENVLPRYIEKNASGAVFVDGKFASGVHIPAIGFVSALFTRKEFRNRGYAKMTMRYAFKEYAKDGCIVCLNVERQNAVSRKFHEGLGMKVAYQNFSVLIKNLNVD